MNQRQVSALTALAAMCLLVVARAQTVHSMVAPMPVVQEPQKPAPQQEMPKSEAAQSSTFTGTVQKAGSGYVLRASSGTYQLDDGGQAQQFEGKQVKVVGKLDPQSQTIHVQSIEGAS
jgi:hypothetical protein